MTTSRAATASTGYDGGRGNDDLYGDELHGPASGSDHIYGQDGNDDIFGGLGWGDDLYGGDDNDVILLGEDG